MTVNTITWNLIRNNILANLEVKKECDRLIPQFELAKKVLHNKGRLNSVLLLPLEFYFFMYRTNLSN